MNANRLNKMLGVFFAALILSLVAGKVAYTEDHESNHSVTYTLRTLLLTNVDDAAGRWQFEGGEVFDKDAMQIGNYATYRRVTFNGTTAQNTAQVTSTIFYLGQNPPQNITLQGSHDFGSGKWIGSVSAASHEKRHFLGDSFEGDTATSQLTLSRADRD